MSDPIQVVATTPGAINATASGTAVAVNVGGGVGPQGAAGPTGPAGPVSSVQGLTGAVTLAVVGGTVTTAGSTVTIAVTAATVDWSSITGKPATFAPSAHSHAIADVTGLQGALDGKQASGSYAAASHGHAAAAITDFAAAVAAAAPPTTNASLLTSGTLDAARLPGSVVLTTDSRLSDSREWSAATVTQADAEAGTATARVAWTVQRVWQAIAAWWAASASKAKLDGIASGATANQTDAHLLSRANHTGTQAAATVTGLAAVATAGTFASLASIPTTRSGYGITDAQKTITSGTAAPSGGVDGDIYLQYS